VEENITKNNAIRSGKGKYDVHEETTPFDILSKYDDEDPEREKELRKQKAFILNDEAVAEKKKFFHNKEN